MYFTALPNEYHVYTPTGSVIGFVSGEIDKLVAKEKESILEYLTDLL